MSGCRTRRHTYSYLPEKMRKTHGWKEMLNTADVVFLCLPDDAAIEAVSLLKHGSYCFGYVNCPSDREGVDVWFA